MPERTADYKIRVGKYVQRGRGWRPARGSAIYLGVLIGALVAAALVLPRVLPGTLKDSESLLGRGRAIDVLPFGGAPARDFAKPPPQGEGFSSWSISASREEIVVGWYRGSADSVEKVTVQVRNAFSGRMQAEWAPEPAKSPSVVTQVAYLPRHNQIWLVYGGHLLLVDIKSGAVMPFPFKGQGGKGDLRAPIDIGYAGFSPETGMLAYTEHGDLFLVTGLGTGRDGKPLETRTLLEPAVTREPSGRTIEGSVGPFAWLEDDLLAAIVTARNSTSVYFVNISDSPTVVEKKVEAPTVGEFVSISCSPKSTGFALLYSREPDRKENPGDEIRVFNTEGRQTGRVRLPTDEWVPPLSWSGP